MIIDFWRQFSRKEAATNRYDWELEHPELSAKCRKYVRGNDEVLKYPPAMMVCTYETHINNIRLRAAKSANTIDNWAEGKTVHKAPFRLTTPDGYRYPPHTIIGIDGDIKMSDEMIEVCILSRQRPDAEWLAVKRDNGMLSFVKASIGAMLNKRVRKLNGEL